MSTIHKYTTYKFIASIILSLLTLSCSDEIFLSDGASGTAGKIQFAAEILQEAVTRANDSGFADGDMIGVYVVDYNGTGPGALRNSDNRGDNVRHTFREADNSWVSTQALLWKDKTTNIDVYAYYPFGSPEDVNSYSLTVATNQETPSSNGTMGGYEASDFLWGKASCVAPTDRVIPLLLNHRMANLRVLLSEGSGFKEGEWEALEKQVLVTNTIQSAKADLATGEITPDGEPGKRAIIPARTGDEWRAIVVPQLMTAGTTLFSITIAGTPYKFSKTEDLEYLSGRMSNFTIKVNRKSPSGDYSLVLVGESITPWKNDLVSHDASTKEYVIINSKPGELKDAITAAGKDYTTLKNLKITGEIDARDFYFMRDEMDALQALNLKEVIIKPYHTTGDYLNTPCNADQLPPHAFYIHSANSGKKSLTRLILPDRLRSIGIRAFYGCSNLTGSLTIPEGVVDIQCGAFTDCRSLTGTLSLPSTLRYIGTSQNEGGELDLDRESGIDFYNGVFSGCGFTCELTLPDQIEVIRGYAFAECKGLYGNLRLPSRLKHLGARAFINCNNLIGSLEIPQGVTSIPEHAFCGCGFNGNLKLHDGISAIGFAAFARCPFRGELKLPKNLAVIEQSVFIQCDFSGRLVLPKTLITIGEQSFAYNKRLSGTLDIPEGVETIGAGAFSHCVGIEGVILPSSLGVLRYEPNFGGAFENCFGLMSLVSKGTIPPIVQSGAFNGVSKENFTVEVPATSVAQYQTASGWCEFKRISAHRQLVCYPATTCALSSERRQTITVDAESAWEISSKPDWCEISPSSGIGKCEAVLTVKAYASQSGKRSADIVFKLKGKNYTSRCQVTQYGYSYAEDEFVILQKASKGNRNGINIVIIGEGYDGLEISNGTYMKDMRETMAHFFGIEPLASYREYFNIYAPVALSTESGIGTVNTVRNTRFNTIYTGSDGLDCDRSALIDYVMQTPGVSESNIGQTLIIVVPNSSDYPSKCYWYENGTSIAFCPKSTYAYPFDSRGTVQHEAAGHGFGHLGDESISHNAFISHCGCSCCGHTDEIIAAKSLGWMENIDLTSKPHLVGWSHLISDPRYSDTVDVFEGGYMHSRGVYRSEQNSCMNNHIPYFNAISRESIVKRIKRYAGEPYSFEEFASVDLHNVGKGLRQRRIPPANRQIASHRPSLIRKSPLTGVRKRKR